MSAESAGAVRHAAAAPGNVDASAWQALRQPARIIETLHRLRLHRDLLTARALGSTGTAATIILAVDAEHGIDFDALHPAPQPFPKAGDSLMLRGNVDGSDLRFQCGVVGPVTVDGRPALRTALPEQIAVLERRAAFRLRLPSHGEFAPATVLGPSGEQALQITDISPLGAGVQARHGDAPTAGDRLQLRIRLPEATVDAAAEVRSATPLAGFTRLGLRFTDLGRESRQRLVEAIHRIERQLIRYARGRR
jgi:c-di-GMP-binding flagellar brake protein YcgR